MGLIKEPSGIDFVVESRPLTEKEREMISRHIREYKANMTKRKSPAIPARKKLKNTGK
ncbi:hypothetical protein V9K67_18860 [Paraflavisolibacter sp. H34]|uniref:hypothetical protein n=1 Tax=Huijunlia imazamoxiresistens TaxID=3127457 RepID=UPI003017D12E